MRPISEDSKVKSFIYIGPNSKTDGDFSSKIWKIERKGKRIITWWGSVEVVKNKRGYKRAEPVALLLSHKRNFPNEDAARRFEQERIESKLTKGYEPIKR